MLLHGVPVVVPHEGVADLGDLLASRDLLHGVAALLGQLTTRVDVW